MPAKPVTASLSVTWQGFYGPDDGQHETHPQLPDAHHRPGEPGVARLHAEVGGIVIPML